MYQCNTYTPELISFIKCSFLKKKNLILNFRAFKEAQNHEPSNLRGWAGQALVAEVETSNNILKGTVCVISSDPQV